MSSSWLSFQPVVNGWLLGFILAGLLLFFVWKELTRNAKLKAFRVAAVVVLIASLAGFLFQPSVKTEREAHQFLLLTKGYDRSRADSLVRAVPSLGVWKTREAASFPDAVEVNEATIREQLHDIAFVAGNGLPYYLVKEGQGFEFLPGNPSKGIIKLVRPLAVKVNQSATISGEINSEAGTTLVLRGPGEAEDSVAITKSGVMPFSLSFTPRQAGLFLYTLTSKDNQRAYSEPVPVEVLPETQLNILLLQNYPTAEVRQLKNFLTEKGHALALRSQVSKTDFRYEFSNREPVKIDRLGKELLASLDVVITDNESLASLNATERRSLEESVNEGLGILILIHTPSLNKIPLSDLPVKKYAKDTVRLSMPEGVVTLPAVPLAVEEEAQAVTRTSARILSGYVQKGAGKAGFQLLNETYRLALEGKTDVYAALWSPLLEGVARLTPDRFQVQLANTFPYYADEPLSVRVVAAGEEPQLKNDGVLLPVQEDVFVDDYWHADTWAGKPGWHTFTTQDSTAFNYYVSGVTEWQSLRQANQATDNSIRRKGTVASTSVMMPSKRIPRLFFFLVFLLAGSFLWLAPKL